MKAGRMMKVIWRIIPLLIIVLILFYLMDDRVKENEPLESPVKQGSAIQVPGNGGETTHQLLDYLFLSERARNSYWNKKGTRTGSNLRSMDMNGGFIKQNSK